MSTEAEQFWNDLYRTRDSWGGRPNPLLTEIVTPLTPGTAADLGCGPGGDTIWLARRGWQVTAVDVSGAAVEGVRAHAAAQGLTAETPTSKDRTGTGNPSEEPASPAQRSEDRSDTGRPGAPSPGRVTAERHDLAESFPAGTFDLISAQYLHTPIGLDRARLFRTAAHALNPGGLLLIVDHGSIAPWSWNQDPDTHFPTPAETAAEIGLDPARWPVLRADMPRRQATGPGGRIATVTDNVLLIQRAPEKESA
ncbi:SAM-dependent methyltransferase [Actinoplanes couchii]|uniref:Methyltransferase n=1 Tax=Actinoplanes couchii TaxID=403638 RepID=A0ABQ3XAJ5_9ACTN|nr:class I SAM-dependent methyltransferase [Actinoplanes couchii]MDR6324836.1 SAM-dependent methyltransferase [Actinoplanes couchii]GID55542.1 methyltransferase [Actinoplanes couchii]